MTEARYFLGIDGGGTRCRARLVDRDGEVLGAAEAGPANVYRSVEVAWANVLTATRDAMADAGLPAERLHEVAAGLGLAGAVSTALQDRVLSRAHPFASIHLLTDAHAATLGAFAGGDGAVLILGTGSVGMIRRGEDFTSVGGLGFPASDQGSGAWLGLKALRESLLALDGLRPATSLTEQVLDTVGRDVEAIIRWQERAQPAQFAALVPLVFGAFEQRDELAEELLRETAREAEDMLDCLTQLGGEQIALMGGLSRSLRPFLSSRICDRLREPAGDAMDGAVLMARRGIGRSA